MQKAPLYLMAVVVVMACDDGERLAANANTVRTDSAGIEIVQHAGPDRPLLWQTEELWRVGGADDDRLTASRLYRRHVDVGENGTVYLLDPTANQMLVISQEGEIRSTLGRPGRGPGELSRPFGVAVGPNGTVWVFDRAKSAFVGWGRDGEVLPERRVQQLVWGQNLAVNADGIYYETREPISSDPEQQKLRRLGSDSSIVVLSYSAPESKPGSYPSCPAFQVSAPPLFSHDLTWGASGAHLVLAPQLDYRIELYRSGDRLRSIRRQVEPLPLDDEAAAKWGATHLPPPVPLASR